MSRRTRSKTAKLFTQRPHGTSISELADPKILSPYESLRAHTTVFCVDGHNL